MTLLTIDPSTIEEIRAFAHFGEGETKFDYLSSGKNADVFRFENYAVKVFNEHAKDTNDPYALARLHNSDLYPTLHYFEPKKFMVVDLVEGQTIYDIEGKNNVLLRDYQKELYQAHLDAQAVGLFTNDVHLNNIMIDRHGNLKVVDVGRFTTQPRGLQSMMMNARTSSSWFLSYTRTHSLYYTSSMW